MLRTRTIRQKLILIIMGSVGTSLLLGYLVFISWFQINQQRHAQHQSQIISQLLSQEFAKLTLTNQIDVAADITSKLNSFDNLLGMVLFSSEGKAIHKYNTQPDSYQCPKTLEQANKVKNTSNKLNFLIPAKYQGLELGQVFVTLKNKTLLDRIVEDRIFIFMSLLLALVFSFLMAHWLEKRFSQPVLNLIHFLERIFDHEQLNQRIQTQEINEFKKLYREVNTLLSRLQKNNTELTLAAITFNTPNAIMITDPNHKILRVNQAFTDITGYTPDEIVGQTPVILRSGKHTEEFYRQIREKLNFEHQWQGEIWNRHKNGELFLEKITIQPVHNSQGKLNYFVAFFTDITEQYYADKKLKELSSFDDITGLSNRKHLYDALEKHLTNQNLITALLCFDINNFKQINDVYGHKLGDQFLAELANRLREEFYDALLLARIGGDEFALITRFSKIDSNQLIFKLEREAERIQQVLKRPFELKQKTIHARGAIGISYVLNNQTCTADSLIKQADSALHQAKKSEDQSILFFDPKAEAQALASIERYDQLKKAIDTNQLVLYYQPQHHQINGLIGAEALVRWLHPEKGLIPPNEFIPLAENSDLILPLGAWVLKTACQQLVVWQSDPNTQHLILAVNVSAKQFFAKDFLEQIKHHIDTLQFDASKLKLELTESLVAKDLEQLIELMHQLTHLGIRISLDDFGTGYSSLSYLQKLPLKQVKIDQSFVCNLLDPIQNDEAIVRTIISLGQAYGFNIIAEGVENKAQLNHLAQLGCQAYQGYYFSKPLPIQEFDKYRLKLI